MLGKYRKRDYISGGNPVSYSHTAARGGMNESNIASVNMYSKIDDPFIPFCTLDVDFDTSPLFGNAAYISNLHPINYVRYLDGRMVFLYKQVMGNDKGITIETCKYNLDADYLVVNNSDISALEWLYMKVCGVPPLESNMDVSDLNATAIKTDTGRYDNQIDAVNLRIQDLLTRIDGVEALQAEVLRWQLEDLYLERERLLQDKQNSFDGRIDNMLGITNNSATASPINTYSISDIRVTNFIRSIKMFYEMIANHAYMISGVELGDTLKNYYTNENNTFGGEISIKLYEALDMKMTRMMHGIFDAMYDSGYMRKFIPSNLCKFNMTIHIHDIRPFSGDTPTGQMLKRIKKNLDLSNQSKIIASDHMAALSIYLLGCEFKEFTTNYNSLNLASISAGNSADVVDLKIGFDKSYITMTDLLD